MACAPVPVPPVMVTIGVSMYPAPPVATAIAFKPCPVGARSGCATVSSKVFVSKITPPGLTYAVVSASEDQKVALEAVGLIVPPLRLIRYTPAALLVPFVSVPVASVPPFRFSVPFVEVPLPANCIEFVPVFSVPVPLKFTMPCPFSPRKMPPVLFSVPVPLMFTTPSDSTPPAPIVIRLASTLIVPPD